MRMQSVCPVICCSGAAFLRVLAFLPRGGLLGTLALLYVSSALADDPVVFDRDLKPVFAASCYGCHGPEKQKGGLRLDSPEAILQGGDNGPVLTPGKPDESPLFCLTVLPPGHADIMPAKGDTLKPEQTDLIKRWIAQGAVFAAADAAPTAPAPAPAPAPATEAPKDAPADTAVQAAAASAESQGPSVLDELAKNVPPPSQDALNALRDAGAVAMPLAAETPLVSVNLQYLGERATDETLALLAPLAQQITWLNLAGTAVTDAGLAQLAAMPNLTSLHLERTGVGDAGLTNLKGLTHLEYLNLYGTKVGDAGLDNLQTLQSLKKLYLWNSQVTAEGGAKIQACLPQLAVNLGIPATAPAASEATVSTPKDLSFLFDAESCCAKARAEGKACDHPCCVEAAAKGEVCLKCNAGAQKKLDLAKLYTADSCCAKAFAEGRFCDHPCCVEAGAKGEVCAKCNPPASKPGLTALFDPESCCAKACAAGKVCDHPCCVEAAAKGEVCLKCNPGAKAKLDAAAAPPQEPPPAAEPAKPAETPPAPEAAGEPPKDAKVALLPRTLEFNRHVRPILSDNCFTCHGFDKNARKAGLRLDVREAALEAKAFVPGRSAESELVRRITAADSDDVMPPRDSGHALKPEQIATLTRWIDEGAEYQPHWSYIPVTCPEPPAVKGEAAVRNPIDQFILAKLEENGMCLSPEADRVTLIRRASFDLTGLPPKPEEVDAFVNDPDPQAYEKLVDRLIASPHFGERMAMQWLDLVRYADTNGYHGDEHRNVWPYRDYVINAFNANKPFDQFTIEQLAGDLLPNPTTEQLVASGYNRMNQLTAEGGAQEKEYLAKYAADRIRTASSVWLATTMGCAECHDHKFDPFTTRDFYSFSAFFADIEEKGVYTAGEKWDPFLSLPSEGQASLKTELETAIASLQQILDTPTDALAAAQRQWESATRAALANAANDWTTLMPETLASSGGSTLSVGEGLAIVSSGTNPERDDYTLTFRTNQQHLTGIRLDVLADSKTGGLSRGNGNVVLTSFEVQLECGGTCTPLAFSKAVADFEQKDFPVAAAIDADPASGWAVSGHEIKGVNRQAVFTFAVPVSGGPGTVLTVRMKHQSQFAQHNIARFRLAITTAADPALSTANTLPRDVLAALTTEEAGRSEEQKQLLAKHYRSVAPELDGARADLKARQERLAALVAEIPTTLITHAVEPRTIRILPRGNWLDETGEIVEPNTPASLPPLHVEGRRATRLDLARWLVSPENPLTARVTVNRWWEQFFGTGLSKVLDDLGSRGEWPVQPELLDWLAAEFVNSGWDTKHMIRLMVTSAAYMQSSIATPEMRAKDPFNRLLARQSQVRLKAEQIRDNALAVSGLLSGKLGGRSVFPYQPDGYWDNCNTFRGPLIYMTDQGEDQYRRGLYTYWKRSFLHPSILAFDAPTREECTAERVVSNTPMQALVLLNDPTYVEAARVFATRILREGGDTPDARIVWAYRQALNRQPSEAERSLLSQLCTKHLAEYSGDPDSAIELIQTGQAPVPKDLNTSELAAWTSIARAILNLHETITRS
ncbi:MAG: DUF1553 domain-containing protein [Candidatus Hydrogenedentes bacterium]|nr:DUF1553 domain-containing protein [Candidatus Hydrogenedentota bacterium]